MQQYSSTATASVNFIAWISSKEGAKLGTKVARTMTRTPRYHRRIRSKVDKGSLELGEIGKLVPPVHMVMPNSSSGTLTHFFFHNCKSATGHPSLRLIS